MANGLDILNAAKKQKQNKALGVTSQASQKNKLKENITSTSFEELENLYLGSDNDITEGLDYTTYPNGEKRPVYDPREEMKQLQNGNTVVNPNSKMPSAILESIMSNPLDMPTEGMQLEESVMDSELQNKTMDIINRLEANDRKGKSYVNSSNQSNTVAKQVINESTELLSSNKMDTNSLAELIENIIDKKFKQYGNTIINESRKANSNSPTMKFMKLGETFTFMDDMNNVYECKMVYKGKGKIKNR